MSTNLILQNRAKITTLEETIFDTGFLSFVRYQHRLFSSLGLFLLKISVDLEYPSEKHILIIFQHLVLDSVLVVQEGTQIVLHLEKVRVTIDEGAAVDEVLVRIKEKVVPEMMVRSIRNGLVGFSIFRDACITYTRCAIGN